MQSTDLNQLAQLIKHWGQELGFQQLAIGAIELDEHEAHLRRWLERGFHGDMHYMAQHGHKRSRPAELEPYTIRVISARMDYLPPARDAISTLNDPDQGYISRYAVGRDYHKMMRKRLTQLAKRIESEVGPFQHRALVDSAPVLEKALGEKAGLGWIGKHTLLLNRRAGSWFFLGELYTDLPLPVDQAATAHCGSCQACIDICPTRAIIAPYQLDARLCISYLTIELKGSIPEPLRRPMGNRVFGCDDCQLVCPWNRFARFTQEPDFHPRHGLDDSSLLNLFNWDEATFLRNTEGSAIRRIGHERWLRNLAVALGNARPANAIIQALQARLTHPSTLVQEHVRWAINEQRNKSLSG